MKYKKGRRIYDLLGRVAFWITWPGLWLMLRWSRRTRLLLICGDEFLVLRGWLGSGEWGLPGGGLHRGEDAVEGLLREVAEETSINLSPQQVRHAFSSEARQQGFRFKFQAFIAEINQKPDIKRQKREIAEIRWQKLNNPAVKLNSDTVQILDWWLNNR